jgi:hypothetical protein
MNTDMKRTEENIINGATDINIKEFDIKIKSKKDTKRKKVTHINKIKS